MDPAPIEPRRTFDEAALAYDDVRPGYPEPLIRDVVSLLGIRAGGRILEIGWGTYSDHIRLPDARREAMFAGIRALIDGRFGGRIRKYHEATLEIRRKRASGAA